MGKLSYFAQIKAIERVNKGQILKVCPDCPETSGIYFLLREENGFKWAYIGQAKHILSRLAGHLRGYQHIDLSIKKHGLWSKENLAGWKIFYKCYPETSLDEMEQLYIKKYANAGYQLHNKTAGGQGEGKQGLDNQKPSRGYYDGVEMGYLRARKEIAHLFNLHLDYAPKKNPPTKLQEKAMQKFKDFMDYESEEKQ